VEWLQHIVEWAQAHPGLSMAATFLISLIECTLLGLFLPGSAILFGLGALVSLDALPFLPTLCLIAGGGFFGDLASYEAGRRYGVALFRRPFFANRPGLVNKGGAFFTRHGGKGLVFAHLIGPLRPLVPAIAGVYGLSRLRFLASIVPAAVAWTLVYVLPGVAFGASLGLAAEVTKRLAIVLLVAAISLWIALWLTRRTVILLARNAERWLNQLTDWSHRHGPLGRLSAGIADPRQPELPALISVGLVVFVLGVAGILSIWMLGGRPPNFDLQAQEAMQHLREPWGIRLAVVALLPGEPLAYGGFAGVLMLTMLIRRRWDVLRHLIMVIVFGVAAYLALTFAPGLRPADALPLHLRQDLALPVAIYGLVPLMFDGHATINRRVTSYGIVTAVLLFLILGRFYLGAGWLSVGLTTLVTALVWTACVGVSFRRHGARDLELKDLWPAVIALVLGIALATHSARARMQVAMPEMAPRQLPVAEWWDNGWRRLPTRRIDMAGRDKQLLNLQWAGALPAIRQSLIELGWEAPPRLGFATGLRWLATSGPITDLPLMPRMHAGHYAVLTLRHEEPDAEGQLLLRLWPSGYVLDEQTPLWIGTVNGQRAGQFFRLLRYPVSEENYTAALATLTPKGFEYRDVHRSSASFPTRLLRPETYP